MRSLLVATLALACLHAPDTVPLYPNGATNRLPRSEIAQIEGPIGKIDGQDVQGQGGSFDLLPGCHVVELDSRMQPAGYTFSSPIYWTGAFPTITYAVRMKPAAHYLIRVDVTSSLRGASRIAVLGAREQDASGAVTDLIPAQSADDINACKAWEAALARGGRR